MNLSCDCEPFLSPGYLCGKPTCPRTIEAERRIKDAWRHSDADLNIADLSPKDFQRALNELRAAAIRKLKELPCQP